MTQLFYTLLAAIGVQAIAGFAAWYQSRRNGTHLQEMRVSLDGRLQELLRVTKIEAEARGVVLGTTTEHRRGEEEREHSDERLRLERVDQASKRADEARADERNKP